MTALIAAVSVAAHAAVEHDSLVQRKQSVVRVSVEKLGCFDARSALLDAATQADALIEIAVDISSETPVVTLHLTGQPEYHAQVLDHGRKLVVDLDDTVHLNPGKTVMATNQSVVQRVRSSLFSLQPRLVSRVVIDLATTCTYRIEQVDGLLSVRLNPTQNFQPSATQTVDLVPIVVATKDDDVAALCAMLEGVREEQRAEAVNNDNDTQASPFTIPSSRVNEALKTALAHTYSAADTLVASTVDVIEQATHGYVEQVEQSAQATPEPRVIVVRSPNDYNPPAFPASKAEARIQQLTSQLQAVKESQFDLSVASLPSFAAVAEEAPGGAAAPSEETPPTMEPPPPPPPSETEETPEDTSAPPPPPRETDETPEVPSDSSPSPTDFEPPPPVAPELKNTVKMIGTWMKKGEENPAEEGLTIVEPASTPDEKPAPANDVKPPPPTPTVASEVPSTAPSTAPSRAPSGEKASPAVSPQMQNTEDLMNQIINIDFREMPLSNVVALLAQKAQVNVIAGPELSGAVTANLNNITLRKAMDTVLRMNGLGIIEEESIFRIVSYDDALAARRKTKMVTLTNAKAEKLKVTLEEILSGSLDATRVTFAIDEPSNTLIISGPEARVDEFEQLALELDIAEPVVPTVTEVIKLNNVEPENVEKLVDAILTPDVGSVASDSISQTIVVTDMPAVMDKVRDLIEQIDEPPAQVSIETMVVDAVLKDNAQTGIDWILNAVRTLNTRGDIIGNLQQLGMETDVTGGMVSPGLINNNMDIASRISFGILTGNVDLRGAIGAQVDNQDAQILANPVVVTLENQKASIMITSELPYQKATQSTTGPPMASTAFKDVGITLEVTPKVSNDDFIIANINAKQSDTKGELNGIPIEDKREATTTLRMKDGQTIFIGGLRRFDNEKTVRKVPILGDIPVMKVMFSNNVITQESTELMIFLTCNIIPDMVAPLTPIQEYKHGLLDKTPSVPDAQHELFHELGYPQDMREPAWHWRRPE